MFHKAMSALVLAALLGSLMITPALADNNDIVIKKKENSDNVILLQLRLRDLGYYNYKITGYFGDFTEQSLKDFQKTNNLSTDGVAGSKTLDLLYSNTAKRNPVEPRIKPKPAPIVRKKYGAMRDWFDYVRYKWKKGMTCTVVDLDTNISYKMVRVGGSLHADVAPATKADTQKLKKTYGGTWSYDRRAVIVYINGEAIAGSTNGQPHGSTDVKGNGMNLANGKLQQVCIHFLNSRTHIHNMRDPDHQYQVKRAAGKVK